MNKLTIFTDGSWDTQSKTGFGAYLAFSDAGLTPDALKGLVKVKRFEETTSTKLEIQTLLWALNSVHSMNQKIIIYTDSQNIIGLPGRRAKLEAKNYRSAKNNYIRNYKLYQEFYRLTDQFDCDFIKVRGHKQSGQKDDVDRIFTLVDRASRNALREIKTGQ